METTSTPQQREIPSQINTPNSEGSTSMIISTTNSSNNNGGGDVLVIHHTQTPPSTPKPISTSHQQTNPYPTTFVQANTSTFKQVVQMLTGSSPSSPKPNPDFISNKNSIPPIKTSQKKHQQHRFKLYERRNQQRNKLIINPLINHGGFINSTGSFSQRNHEIFSPSFLDFPNKLVLSPVTPLTEDPFNNNNNNSSSNKSSSSPLMVSSSEEDKVIAERGFYLHPSPVNTPRECELQLLPLFPVTSPRVSGSCS